MYIELIYLLCKGPAVRSQDVDRAFVNGVRAETELKLVQRYRSSREDSATAFERRIAPETPVKFEASQLRSFGT